MKNFLTFKTMLSPWLIQILFWIAIAGLLIVAIIDMVHGVSYHILFEVLIIGPIAMRVVCEILILFFRINNHLLRLIQIAEQIAKKNNPPAA